MNHPVTSRVPKWATVTAIALSVQYRAAAEAPKWDGLWNAASGEIYEVAQDGNSLEIRRRSSDAAISAELEDGSARVLPAGGRGKMAEDGRTITWVAALEEGLPVGPAGIWKRRVELEAGGKEFVLLPDEAVEGGWFYLAVPDAPAMGRAKGQDWPQVSLLVYRSKRLGRVREFRSLRFALPPPKNVEPEIQTKLVDAVKDKLGLDPDVEIALAPLSTAGCESAVVDPLTGAELPSIALEAGVGASFEADLAEDVALRFRETLLGPGVRCLIRYKSTGDGMVVEVPIKLSLAGYQDEIVKDLILPDAAGRPGPVALLLPEMSRDGENFGLEDFRVFPELVIQQWPGRATPRSAARLTQLENGFREEIAQSERGVPSHVLSPAKMSRENPDVPGAEPRLTVSYPAITWQKDCGWATASGRVAHLLSETVRGDPDLPNLKKDLLIALRFRLFAGHRNGDLEYILPGEFYAPVNVVAPPRGHIDVLRLEPKWLPWESASAKGRREVREVTATFVQGAATHDAGKYPPRTFSKVFRSPGDGDTSGGQVTWLVRKPDPFSGRPRIVSKLEFTTGADEHLSWVGNDLMEETEGSLDIDLRAFFLGARPRNK